jgi:hypothetical protein
VVELSEYALARIEGAGGYDVDGMVGGILERLEELDHEACKRAEPDQEALAKRLFEWELGGDHDTFFDAVHTYADVLGNNGLAEYDRLAKEEWAGVPALGPGREDMPRYYGKRERLAGIMEALAYRSGDVEGMVDIKSKDLSNSFAYVEIAQIYKQADDDEKAWSGPKREHGPSPAGATRISAASWPTNTMTQAAMRKRWASSGRGSPNSLASTATRN